MFYGKKLASLLALVLAGSLSAAPLTKEEKVADFQQLTQSFAKNYGMLPWKKAHLGLELGTLKAQYLPLIEATTTDGQFYQVMSAFIAEWQDAHLSFQPREDVAAFLGFSVRRIEGKAIIVNVNRKALPENIFPFNPGDEVMSIDGEAVERIADKLRHLVSAGNEEATLGLVYRELTVRVPNFGAIPRGNASLQIRRYGEDQAVGTSLPWIVVGKPLPGSSGFVGIGKGGKPTTGVMEFAHPMASMFAKTGTQAGDLKFASGAHDVDAGPFKAFTVDSPKGPIGFIRIPSFSPESEEKAVEGFKKGLKEMWYTRGLILDLRDNPGGSLFYGYKLASMLTDKPLTTPTFSLRSTRDNILSYRGWSEQAGSAAERAGIDIVVGALEKAYAAGENLTDYLPIDGLATISPDPDVQYTKPIVILISNQCYSMGDIWPALMRDNGRAVLFGSTTAGAGGAVVGFGPLVNSEAGYSLTVNILKRQNGQPVENLGVSPDVAFEVTVDDMAQGSPRYTGAFMQTLLEQIQ